MRKKLIALAVAVSMALGAVVLTPAPAQANVSPCSHSYGYTSRHYIGWGWYHSVDKFANTGYVWAAETMFTRRSDGVWVRHSGYLHKCGVQYI